MSGWIVRKWALRVEIGWCWLETEKNAVFGINDVQRVDSVSTELMRLIVVWCFSELSEEEICRIRGDLLNLDRFLGPYPFDIWKRWKELTSKVTGMYNIAWYWSLCPKSTETNCVKDAKLNLLSNGACPFQSSPHHSQYTVANISKSF